MNYYEILRVSKNASQEEIRNSYKNLIKRYHPDIYSGNQEYAEKITKELNDAYKTLSNEEKRKEYDNMLFPPEIDSNNINTYTNSYQKIYNKKAYYSKKEYSEPIYYSIEDMMKEKIHNAVDKHSTTMTRKSKIILLLVIIIFALFLLILSINDYINLIDTINKNRDIKSLKQNIILQEQNIIVYK